MQLWPKGRYLTLKRVELKDGTKDKKEDSLGIEGFDFGFDSSSKSSLDNDMFEVFEVVRVGHDCQMGFGEGDKVVTYQNVTERINLMGDEVFFTTEGNVIGVVV